MKLPYNPTDKKSVIDYAKLLKGKTLRHICNSHKPTLKPEIAKEPPKSAHSRQKRYRKMTENNEHQHPTSAHIKCGL